jgi:hypothetical protein
LKEKIRVRKKNQQKMIRGLSDVKSLQKG